MAERPPVTVVIPVVILTTSNADSDVERAYANHANSYLVKRPNFAQFRAQMQDLSTYWGQFNISLP